MFDNEAPPQETPALTDAQLRQAQDHGTTISGIVVLDLNEFLASDMNAMEVMSMRLTGTDQLVDIEFTILGYKDGSLYLRVTGNPSEIELDDEKWGEDAIV